MQAQGRKEWQRQEFKEVWGLVLCLTEQAATLACEQSKMLGTIIKSYINKDSFQKIIFFVAATPLTPWRCILDLTLCQAKAFF